EVISPHFEQWKPWLVAVVVVGALLFFALVIALTWLKARGNFIFTDCVVRNQAAIVEPWREYRKEGNSYFLFLLAVMFAVLLLAGLILTSVIGLGWLKQGAGETGSITSIGLLVFLGLFWFSIVIFVSSVRITMSGRVSCHRNFCLSCQNHRLRRHRLYPGRIRRLSHHCLQPCERGQAKPEGQKRFDRISRLS